MTQLGLVIALLVVLIISQIMIHIIIVHNHQELIELFDAFATMVGEALEERE